MRRVLERDAIQLSISDCRQATECVVSFTGLGNLPPLISRQAVVRLIPVNSRTSGQRTMRSGLLLIDRSLQNDPPHSTSIQGRPAMFSDDQAIFCGQRLYGRFRDDI
jgi:hypothetical protein